MNKLLAISLLLPLTGCLDAGESFYVPTDIAPLFGGGAAVVRPAPPKAQPHLTGTGIMMVREQHGAVNPSNCYDIEARFKRAGRRVRLVEIRPNASVSGGVLAWICEFEDDGSDEADSGFYQPRY